MNKPKGQVCKKFILQLSIFIIYISCRGNRGDVAAAYCCGLAPPRWMVTMQTRTSTSVSGLVGTLADEWFTGERTLWKAEDVKSLQCSTNFL